MIQSGRTVISLADADLRGINLSGEVGEVVLRGANLSKAYLSRANLRNVNLGDCPHKSRLIAHLSGTTEEPNLIEYMSRADLNEVALKDCLRRAELRGSLDWGQFFDCLNEAAQKTKAGLAFTDVLEYMREAGLSEKADLRHAHLNDSDLRGAVLVYADLRRADLRRAKLNDTILWGANLSDAVLGGADLSKASLDDRTNLDRAYLAEAVLKGTQLRGVDLQKTNGLKQTQIEQAVGDHTTRLPRSLRLPEAWEDA